MKIMVPPDDRPRWFRVWAGLSIPVLLTVAGLLFPAPSTAGAGFIYVLGVVSAALFGGILGGLIASGASFFALNFFFTPPYRTFRVDKVEDAIALAVFLVVSTLAATLFTQALVQKMKAERRERESFLLHRFSSGLLLGTGIDEVLARTARDLSELLGLGYCEVRLNGKELGQARYDGPGYDPDKGVEIPLRTERSELGVLRLFPRSGREISSEETNPATAIAAQIALAVEAADLDQQTRTAKADAEANRIRAALFSSVTHDLKTPLASIKASASSLLSEQVSFKQEQRTELLQTIVEESDRLNLLIGNLLQLSRVRAGALVPNKTLVPIEDLIASVTRRLEKLFPERRLRIRVRDGLPLVPMDVVQIDQVLSNILENASRYAPKESEVEIRAGKWHEWAEVMVADHGPGIPPDQRERVFDEFFQVDSAGSSGSGLGLSIVRAIVTAHGGSAWVCETPGGGTTVGFRLPIGP